MIDAARYDHYDYPTADPEAGEGYYGHLTPEQQKKVDDLRSELAGEGYSHDRLDTLTLVRLPSPKRGG